MAKSSPINTANPPSDSSPRLGDDYIRTLAAAVVEILNVDHYVGTATSNAYNEDDAGKHSKVTFRESQATAPTLGDDDVGIVYIKQVESTGEIFFRDEAGNEIQLTTGGVLRGESLKLANDSPLLARNAADDGDVSLIQADADDGVEIPDALKVGGKITNVTDPTEDQDAATKVYVDTGITAATKSFGAWASSPSGYATSVTAETDGFVVAYSTGSNENLVGETPVGTIRQKDASYTAIRNASIMMPVRSGDTWRVTGSTARFWIPLA